MRRPTRARRRARLARDRIGASPAAQRRAGRERSLARLEVSRGGETRRSGTAGTALVLERSARVESLPSHEDLLFPSFFPFLPFPFLSSETADIELFGARDRLSATTRLRVSDDRSDPRRRLAASSLAPLRSGSGFTGRLGEGGGGGR